MLVVVVLVALPAAAQKADFVKQGPATPPAIEASEDYPVNYPGGPAPAPIQGALDQDDSTYNRVLTDCGGLSGVGTAVYYDTVTITNSGPSVADMVVFTSDQGNPAGCTDMDTFLTAYDDGGFNPTDPLTNCVAANDDSGSLCSQITFQIPSGLTYVVVMTSFANGATFNYQVNFDGTVPVELQSINVE
jgi:hypothetical protein